MLDCVNFLAVDVPAHRILAEPEILSRLGGCQESFAVVLNCHYHASIVDRQRDK